MVLRCRQIHLLALIFGELEKRCFGDLIPLNDIVRWDRYPSQPQIICLMYIECFLEQACIKAYLSNSYDSYQNSSATADILDTFKNCSMQFVMEVVPFIIVYYLQCVLGWSQISQVDRSHMLACAHVWHDHRMPPGLFPGSYVQPPKVTEASSVCSCYLVMYPHIEAFEEASVTLGGCTHWPGNGTGGFLRSCYTWARTSMLLRSTLLFSRPP